MRKEELTQKEKTLIIEGYKKTKLGLTHETDWNHMLFCQAITCDELEEDYDIDENHQLIRIAGSADMEEIGDLPDCVKRLELLQVKGIEIPDEELLDLVCEICSIEDHDVAVYIGGGCFDYDWEEDTENNFENRITDDEYDFIITAEESDKNESDEDGYHMTDVLDGFYLIKKKVVAALEGGGCCPMIFDEYTEESSGNTTVYKLLRALVDEPLSAEEFKSVDSNAEVFTCDEYGTPKEDGKYRCVKETRKVYRTN